MVSPSLFGVPIPPYLGKLAKTSDMEVSRRVLLSNLILLRTIGTVMTITLLLYRTVIREAMRTLPELSICHLPSMESQFMSGLTTMHLPISYRCMLIRQILSPCLHLFLLILTFQALLEIWPLLALQEERGPMLRLKLS